MPTMALRGLKDKPRPGKQPIYTKATDKRILRRWTNRHQRICTLDPDLCWPRRWAMLTSNMSSGSCAATRSTSWLASPGVRATTRTSRPKPPMSLASMSPRPRGPLCYAWTKSLRSPRREALRSRYTATEANRRHAPFELVGIAARAVLAVDRDCRQPSFVVVMAHAPVLSAVAVPPVSARSNLTSLVYSRRVDCDACESRRQVRGTQRMAV